MAKVRTEINIINAEVTTTGDYPAFVSLNTYDYYGTTTYYFEVVGKVASGSATAALERSGTTTVDSVISVTGSTPQLFRSEPFSPPTGRTTYNLYLSGGTTPAIESARIVIINDNPYTEFQFENTVTGNTFQGRTFGAGLGQVLDMDKNEWAYWMALSGSPGGIFAQNRYSYDLNNSTSTTALDLADAFAISLDKEYAYIGFGTAPAGLQRYSVSAFTKVDLWRFPTGQNHVRGIVNDNDFIYISLSGSGVTRIRKSGYTGDAVYNAVNNACGKIAQDNDYVYVAGNSSPAKVYRFTKQANWTATTAQTLSLTGSGEDFAFSIDCDDNYVYVGMLTSPAKIARINKATIFSTTTYTTLTLPTNYNNCFTLVDGADGNIYAATHTVPGRVARIPKATDWFNATASTKYFEFDSGYNYPRAMVRDPNGLGVGFWTNLGRFGLVDFFTPTKLGVMKHQVEIGGDQVFNATTPQPFTYPKYFYYEPDYWSAAGVSAYMEATISCSTSMTAFVLLEVSDGGVDGFSGWTTVASATSTATAARLVSSTATTISPRVIGLGNFNYRVTAYGSVASAFRVSNVKLILQQNLGFWRYYLRNQFPTEGSSYRNVRFMFEGLQSNSGPYYYQITNTQLLLRFKTGTTFNYEVLYSGGSFINSCSQLTQDSNYLYTVSSFNNTTGNLIQRISKTGVTTYSSQTRIQFFQFPSSSNFAQFRGVDNDTDYVYTTSYNFTTVANGQIIKARKNASWTSLSYSAVNTDGVISGNSFVNSLKLTSGSTYIIVGDETRGIVARYNNPPNFSSATATTVTVRPTIRGLLVDTNDKYVYVSTGPAGSYPLIYRIILSSWTVDSWLYLKPPAYGSEAGQMAQDENYIYFGQWVAFISAAFRINKNDFRPQSCDSLSFTLYTSGGDGGQTGYIGYTNSFIFLGHRTLAPTFMQYVPTFALSSATKFESQYLLTNTLLSAGTGYQGAQSIFDLGEYSGVDASYAHAVDGLRGSTSSVSMYSMTSTTSGELISGSTVIPSNQRISGMTAPLSVYNLDIRATTNNNDVYASRMLARISLSTITRIKRNFGFFIG